MPHITASRFTDRFVSLILGARDLPKKEEDLHVLLISSIVKLDPSRQYSEPELNEERRKWTALFGSNFGLDHVALRRFLVDERYLARDTAGTTYERQAGDRSYTFDASIESIDLKGLINEARREREKRKQLHRKAPRV